MGGRQTEGGSGVWLHEKRSSHPQYIPQTQTGRQRLLTSSSTTSRGGVGVFCGVLFCSSGVWVGTSVVSPSAVSLGPNCTVERGFVFDELTRTHLITFDFKSTPLSQGKEAWNNPWGPFSLGALHLPKRGNHLISPLNFKRKTRIRVRNMRIHRGFAGVWRG